MLNVQNITAKLASLPDQALQQYAAMNKDDPYIMSLAMSESNRRKQIRAAQQSQGMQEQPKVVDQAIQDMAQPMPEDVGIAQLPAGEMEFAGGGILAFAQGDSIPGAKGPKERWQDMQRRPDETSTEFARRVEKAKEEAFREEMGGPGKFLKFLREQDEPRMGVVPQEPAPKPQVRQDPLRAQEAAAGIPDGSVVPPVMSGTPDMPNADAAGPTAPAAPAAPTGIAQVAAPTAATAAPVSMDYAGASKGITDAGLFKQATAEDYAEQETALKDVAQKRIDAAKERQTREEKFQKELGEYGVGKEKRLKEREEKLGKDEKANYGLAFLEAGLAMMGGKDQNAFANISAGALQGLGSYKTGLAKLNDRKEKLFDAYDALEDARRSDRKDKFARMEAAAEKVTDAEIALKQVSADIIGKRADFNREQTRALGRAVIDTANTEYKTKSQAAQSAADRETNVRLATAKMQSDRAIAEGQQATQRYIAQLPGDMQKLYTTLGNGDPVAGLKLAKEIEATGKKDIMTVYTEWLKANPTLAMDPNKAMAAFFKQYSVMSGKIPKASDKPTGAVRE